jgi:hypothetical protein
MGEAQFEFIDTLVAIEIERIVRAAANCGECLSTSHVATQITKIFPNMDLSERDLVDQIIVIASKAGVPLEINSTHVSAPGVEFADRDRGPTCSSA